MKNPFKDPTYTRDKNDIPEGDLNMDDGSLNGGGTPERPFDLDSIHHSTILRIANIAKARSKPVYCKFEKSTFLINPDGTMMQEKDNPLRDGLADTVDMYLSVARKGMIDALNS